MQEAVPVGQGAMAALLGADLGASRRIWPRPLPKAKCARPPTIMRPARW